MLTTKDMGVSGANNARQVPRHRRHRQPRSRRRASAACPATSPCPTPCQHRPDAPATSAATSSARSTTRSRPAATRTRRTSSVQQPNLAAGPDAGAARRPPQRWSSTSTRPAGHRRACPTSQGDGPLRRRGVRVRQRADGPARRSTSARKTRAARPLRPATAGARARCWPAGWSRPARTFVTVHFGGWDHHWDLQEGLRELPAEGRCRRRRRCSRTWTTAACWTRRWWCCAASSAGRRR